MKKIYKNYRVIVLSVIIAGMISIEPSRTDCEVISRDTNESPLRFETVTFTQISSTLDIHDINPFEMDEKPRPNPAINATENENVPTDLNEILEKYYGGETSPSDERAFKRVLSWKEDFESIAKDYKHVDWTILASIVKVETQGKTGRQISNAMAIGMPQIKYQGAWAFFWDAMFSKSIKQGSILIKDYYNDGIRSRYSIQLDQISQHLKEKDILIPPPKFTKSTLAYRQARSDTWENLKIYLRREYEPGEYQVAVDIAAMYIDHLIDTFYKVRKQIVEIKQYVEQNRITNIEDIQISGTKKIRLRRIKEYLVTNPGNTASGTIQESTLNHINNILKRFEDPNIYSSAYNFGPRKVLEYIHSGKNWPKSIEDYVKKVAAYNTIFIEIEKSRISV
jgi:hypothetical protein